MSRRPGSATSRTGVSLSFVCAMSLVGGFAHAADDARSPFGREPQVSPDAPNQPQLGSARLDPGTTYRNVIVYRLFVNEARARSGRV